MRFHIESILLFAYEQIKIFNFWVSSLQALANTYWCYRQCDVLICLFVCNDSKRWRWQDFFCKHFGHILIEYLLWIVGSGRLRGFVADYGVPLMVLVWTGLSYTTLRHVPTGIPRRLFSPNPWSHNASRGWTVIRVGKHHRINHNSQFFFSSLLRYMNIQKANERH